MVREWTGWNVVDIKNHLKQLVEYLKKKKNTAEYL